LQLLALVTFLRTALLEISQHSDEIKEIAFYHLGFSPPAF